MPRNPPQTTFGIGINSNLIPKGVGTLDFFYQSEGEKTVMATTITNAQATANTAQTTADTAQTTATNALTIANTATTNITTLNTSLTATNDLATFANLSASGANSRLAGDNDYFYGEYLFTGTPQLSVPYFTSISSSGIDYSAGYFNFSYLGTYLFFISISGDCANTRADWYQEISVNCRENSVISTDINCISMRLPPSGTWNFQKSGSAPIRVQAGNKWRPIMNMTTGGSTTNGKLKILIKKIV